MNLDAFKALGFNEKISLNMIEARLRQQVKGGSLRIFIEKCAEVVKIGRTPNPYITLKLGDIQEVKRSPIQKSTAEPKWFDYDNYDLYHTTDWVCELDIFHPADPAEPLYPLEVFLYDSKNGETYNTERDT
eukprot:UN05650